jgi:hypothetical protein
MIDAQIANWGSFRDTSLSAWFVLQGGFLFIFDGLNEISSDKVKDIRSYVTENQKRNKFILSSQVKHDEFSDGETMFMTGMTEAFIAAFLKHRKEIDASEIPDFAGRIHQLQFIETPFDLEQTIELWRTQRVLPESIIDLYEKAITPILVGLDQKGYRAGVDLLYKTSFEMIRDYQEYLPNEPDYPGTVITALTGARMLVRERGRLRFRHDLLRSFLGSVYCVKESNFLFADKGLKLHSDFISLLKFSVPQIEDQKAFIFDILNLNYVLAGKVFQYAKELNIPMPWEADFYKKYTEYSLRS